MRRSSLLPVAFLYLFLLTGAQDTVIDQECSFTSGPTHRVEAGGDGSSVCLELADTNPGRSNTWHFIGCPGTEFKATGPIGNAVLCRNYNGEPGIGIDFRDDVASESRLSLICSTSNGTTTTVVRFTALIRPENSIEYLRQSENDRVSTTIGQTAVIAKFVGRSGDLSTIDAPPGVNCTNMVENNCIFAAFSFDTELTATCKVTPMSVEDSGVKIFIRNNTTEVLARVMLNVMPNATESPGTNPTTGLGVGDIIGLAIGVLVLVFLAIIVVLVTAFLLVVWFGGKPKKEFHPIGQENGHAPRWHVAFSNEIREIAPADVLSRIVQHCNAEEFTLNGRSVADRFEGVNDKIRYFTTDRRYSEVHPSADANSSLAAQIRHLQEAHRDRVEVIVVSNDVQEGEDGQAVDGAARILQGIEEAVLQQQPRSSLEREISRTNKLLQSLYRMTFQWIIDWRASQAGPAVPNGHIREEGAEGAEPEDPNG